MLALKSDDGVCEFDQQNKACVIPPETNEYAPLLVADRRQFQQDVPSESAAATILKNLAADSATGPGKLPARILKECPTQLAKPFRMLAMVILKCGVWPPTCG